LQCHYRVYRSSFFVAILAYGARLHRADVHVVEVSRHGVTMGFFSKFGHLLDWLHASLANSSQTAYPTCQQKGVKTAMCALWKGTTTAIYYYILERQERQD
jgi:hypothetical protein